MNNLTEEFLMRDYGKKSCFASFLPGIAGIKGIPIWCYYVNRGQGVVSFGVDHKDHAIMEFYPAHMAYQNVKRTGFRTFLRRNGVYGEAFHNEDNPHTMQVGMNTLAIQEDLRELNLQVDVSYYILPEETIGALVRKVTITNTADEECRLEVLDGMPEVIPYGVQNDSMKNMTQTAKAWMQVEDVESKIPYYRVRASMDDTASVSIVEGGNFAMGVMSDGSYLTPVVDPETVFGYDNSLERPVIFCEEGLDGVARQDANYTNLLPSGFFMVSKDLQPGESFCFFELIGQVEEKGILRKFLEKKVDGAYLEEKKARAVELVEELVEKISTETGDARFDAYCKYTYMDNVLRGGYPIPLGHNKIFYVYSRKHGDLERDYNYFAMAPEFYSQGNGNFRDVNQNRRLDAFFAPFVGTENIHLFYSLIQLDGYNPLGIEKLTYTVSPEKAHVILEKLKNQQGAQLEAFVTRPFTPGALYKKLADLVDEGTTERLFGSLIDFAEPMVNGNFGEGYWSDHWDYNLDLIEEYLSVFPEKEKEMLYENAYTFFLSQVNVNPRSKRYAKTPNGIRQYYALNEQSRRTSPEKVVREQFGKGEVLHTTLMGKLLLLCATKFATLDPYGMGIEMEGGKPGWYDALNGMPGMLGSSMAETYELARMMDYTIAALEKYPTKVAVLKELANFMEELDLINHLEQENIEQQKELLSFWNKINDAKEIYREKTYLGVSGETSVFESEKLAKMLRGWRETLRFGIRKAVAMNVCPTYFTYEVKRYTEAEDGIHPLEFAVNPVPLFLEGPVRYLKLDEEALDKKTLYDFVKNSDLYDRKLSMYKVNASLADASYELGRALAFTPGWLENESIWLHMEYKYLLELLKSGMYEEYAEDFYSAGIPFLDEEVYGRSTLENSSFLASSKNPNPKIHGKGFVARLSGSTVEFLNMWKIMMFGKTPFTMEQGALQCRLEPTIPSYLIGRDKVISAMFLGATRVIYKLPDAQDFFPGNYQCESMEIVYKNKTRVQLKGGTVEGQLAYDLRNGEIVQMEVCLCRR